MTALQELIDRVARGGHDELWPYTPDDLRNLTVYSWMVDANYGGDTHAAMKLINRLIPGWRISNCGEEDDTTSGWRATLIPRNSIVGAVAAYDQPNGGRALLLAALRAHQAQQEGKG